MKYVQFTWWACQSEPLYDCLPYISRSCAFLHLKTHHKRIPWGHWICLAIFQQRQRMYKFLKRFRPECDAHHTGICVKYRLNDNNAFHFITSIVFLQLQWKTYTLNLFLSAYYCESAIKYKNIKLCAVCK